MRGVKSSMKSKRIAVCYPLPYGIQTMAFVTIRDGIIEDKDYSSSNNTKR